MFNLFKNLKSKSFALFVFVVFFALFPRQAYGFAFDLPTNLLAGLSELTGPVMALYIFSIIIYILGYVAILVTTELIHGIINQSNSFLTLGGGEAGNIIYNGWSYSVEIVNLLLIAAFVIIAFSIIIDHQKITLKKTLPRLILVALLINFSFLFIRIGLDISNILFNTVANLFGEQGLSNPLMGVVEPLIISAESYFLSALAYIASLGLLMKVPFVNVYVQAIWLVGFHELILESLIFGATLLILAGTFLIYFIILFARIFIIQLLVVIAPFAFFCLIFEDTKKYWNQWLNNFIQWALVGVFFVFVLFFGLLFAPIIQSFGAAIVIGVLPNWLKFVGGLMGYIFLSIYYLAIALILKKFIPKSVSALMDQGSQFVKTVSPVAKGLAQGMARGSRAQSLRMREGEKQRMPIEPTRFQSFQKGLRDSRDRASTLMKGVTPDQEYKELMKQKKDKALERSGGSAEEAMKYIKAKGRLANSDDRYIAGLLAQDDGKAMGELAKDKDLLGSVISEMSNRKDKNVIKMTPHLLGDDTAILSAAKLNQKDVIAKLRSDGYKEVDEANFASFIKDLNNKNVMEKATISVSLSKMKTDDIKNLPPTVFENNNFNAALRESKGPQEIANILNGHDYEVIKEFEESIIKELKNPQITQRSLSSIKKLLNTPASKSLLAEAESFSKQKIEREAMQSKNLEITKEKIDNWKQKKTERRQAEIDASVRQGIEREEKKSKDLEAAKERVDSWKQKNTERMQAEIDASVKREIEKDAREKQQKDLDRQKRSASAKKGWETRDYNEYLEQAKKDHDQAAKEEKDRFDIF